jgi:hypothetical protein
MWERPSVLRLAFSVARKLVGCLFVVCVFCLAPTSLEKLAPAALQLVASAQATEPVDSCGLADASGANNIFAAYSTFGITYYNFCGDGAQKGLLLQQDGVNSENPGQTASWYTNTPPGLVITNAVVIDAVGAGTVGTGYEAYFYWTGGSQRVTNASSGAFASGIPSATTFGFLLECNPSGTTCPPDGGITGAAIEADDVQLTVAETVNPSVTAVGANNLWYEGASEFVRGGGWSVAYSASAPSGIAGMAASENAQPISDPTAPAPGCNPNHTEYQQCPGSQTWSPTIALSGNGPQVLTLSATSAAGNNSSPTETISVDSVQPTVTLSGPSSASLSAGTQYVTATASVGGSGLGAISCSVDGGPQQSYKTSPAQVPVSGLGSHSVECTASNRAYNSAGQVAVSAPATFSMDIAEPTVSGISFTNILHSLKCKKVEERVKVAATWVTVRRHGKLVKVHRRPHIKREKVMKCKMRQVERKVTVTVKVKRNGKTVLVKRKRVERIPVPPEAVTESTKRVAFGKGTTITGFLDTATGTALAGRTVDVLTAPDNQLGQWSQAAAVTTETNGGWTATLPPGPSRLVEAAYPGDSTTLPATSATATLLVRAHIGISVTPRRLPWSGVVTIRGHLAGGYVPPDGVPLYLEIKLPHNHRPYKPVPLRTNTKGTFAVEWSWGSGVGVSTLPMSIKLLGTGSDYPFLASSSRAVDVTFGRPTPEAAKHARAHHRKRKRHKK